MNLKSSTMKCLVGSMIVSVFGIMMSCLPEPLSIDGLPVVKPEIVVSTQIIPDRALVVPVCVTLLPIAVATARSSFTSNASSSG